MTVDELVLECKLGLGISFDNTAFDNLLRQKIRAVQSFMKNAGVSAAKMDDDLAAGVVVMAVNDLWENQSGEVKFSPALQTLLSQLTYDDVVTP